METTMSETTLSSCLCRLSKRPILYFGWAECLRWDGICNIRKTRSKDTLPVISCLPQAWHNEVKLRCNSKYIWHDMLKSAVLPIRWSWVVMSAASGANWGCNNHHLTTALPGWRSVASVCYCSQAQLKIAGRSQTSHHKFSLAKKVFSHESQIESSGLSPLFVIFLGQFAAFFSSICHWRPIWVVKCREEKGSKCCRKVSEQQQTKLEKIYLSWRL